MGPINPWNDPAVVYLRALLGCRIERLRNEPDRTKGASAIEWAIITAILAVIAITIGATIRNLIVNKANSIKTE
ncbi:Flp family type IVb pilin [Actinomadura sp. 9N407]|uniref:Flp family type IVb pilin n=1 Tax=Actinomadura sp. 9N407 TaxID=3375154 RepID=UPI0037997D7E